MSPMSAVLAVDAETLTVTTIDPWDAVLAVAVAIVGWILSRVTRKAVGKLLTRLQGLSDELRDLTARAAGYVVLFVGFGVALSIIGVPIQPLVTAVIVIGVILALALRGIAENFAAGIVLQTRRPIDVGDEVDSLDYVGECRRDERPGGDHRYIRRPPGAPPQFRGPPQPARQPHLATGRVGRRSRCAVGRGKSRTLSRTWSTSWRRCPVSFPIRHRPYISPRSTRCG